MIAAKRTSRDAAAIILPVLLILTVLMTYVSLASIGLVPVVGTISADAIWVMPITVLLWFVLLKYVYGLIHPVIYLTEIFPRELFFRTHPTQRIRSLLRETMWSSSTLSLRVGGIARMVLIVIGFFAKLGLGKQ